MTVFGTDPEFFAVYRKEGEPYALPPVFFRKYLGVKASNDPRHPVYLKLKDVGAILHEDGAAFEMSIRPSTKWEDLFDNVNYARTVFGEKVLSHFPSEVESHLQALPTVNWDVARWSNEGDDFYMATTFGCDPDYDAFHYDTEEHVVDATKHPYRYGGGHIHFSGIEGFSDAPLMAVHCLAFTAGLAGVAHSTNPKLDHLRTYLYGKPGKFRVQKYSGLWENIPFTDTGIEYRTLSNLWTSDKSIASQVFEWANIGIDVLFGKRLIKKLFKKLNGDVQKAIVKCDQTLAAQLLDTIKTHI